MGLIAAVLAGFPAALLAPSLHRRLPRAAGWLLAAVPAVLTAYFLSRASAVFAGEPLSASWAWVPSVGVSFSFVLDGLGLVFALLICGIGTVVVIYGREYLHGHPLLGRFYLYLLGFMAAMLGLVLSDNLIALFLFWELTSVTSFLLIGFDHERERARWAALQAWLVTGLGGLAMLGGFVLLAQAGGSYDLSVLLARGDQIRASEVYLPALALILAGAFTKSAQFPFHFWLPNAMEAPTPVSAYLHSATMVKAGVYLLARLHPALGGTPAWTVALVSVGAATVLVGAWFAVQQTDLKRILAYSTVSALGTLVLLLGVGTPEAITAAMLWLVAHASYKGALFLFAGAVDHETGTRDVTQLGGLRRAMPVTAALTFLAALSMAGLPPLAGFMAKESVLAALLHHPVQLGVFVVSSALLFVAAANTGLRPFAGVARPLPRKAHEAPASMWAGPGLLALLGLAFGLAPGLLDPGLVSAAAASVLGRPAEVHLALFHGLNLPLLFSAVALGGGAALYVNWDSLRAAGSALQVEKNWAPRLWYDHAVKGLTWTADANTRILQSGYLRYYLLTVIAATGILVSYTLITREGLPSAVMLYTPRLYEIVLAGLILAAAWATIRARSRLAAVAALGVVGYGVALLFALFGAPDLAMTQFLIETLTVIMLVLVLYYLPRFARLSTRRDRARDAIAALTAGGVMTLLVLASTAIPSDLAVTEYFARTSYPEAHGRNIVNVILVDFRALDTLGEITVLAVAGMGVYALLKLRPGTGGD